MDNAAVLRGIARSYKETNPSHPSFASLVDGRVTALIAGAEALELLAWLFAKDDSGFSNLERVTQNCYGIDDVESRAREMWAKEKR